jgi:cell division septal protein FtsQ
MRYNERKKASEVSSWTSEVKAAITSYFHRRRKRIAVLAALSAFSLAACAFVVPSVTSEEFMPLAKITPKKMNRISEEAFRKIIGYDYDEKVYIRDTAAIRARLEASDMIYGDVRFYVKLIPYSLEVEFSEASPLFVLMKQGSDSLPLVYSNKGKIYPYGGNIANLPVVEANNFEDVVLATNFLMDMKENDEMLYSRVSQLIPSQAERQINVFFSDVDFKTKFSTQNIYWKEAFKYYRQLTGNAQVLDINSVAVLDLRFRQMAYTIEKQGRI